MGDRLNATDANMFENESKAVDVGHSYEDHVQHEVYKSFDSRLLTFADWPQSTGQKPNDLAEAGFFYTGDEVRCFYCNLRVWNWQPKDDPWVEHVNMNNPCKFARETLGRDGVNDILRSQQAKAKQEACFRLEGLGHSESGINKALETIQGAGALTESTITRAADNLRDDGASGGIDDAICISCNASRRQVMFVPCHHTVVAVVLKKLLYVFDVIRQLTEHKLYFFHDILSPVCNEY